MPVEPFTHNHRRHPITHYGHNDYLRDRDIVAAALAPSDVDQPVTVADLLDAYQDTPDHNVWPRADHATVVSACRILNASRAANNLTRHLAALSPDERSEFDRRTGADRD